MFITVNISIFDGIFEHPSDENALGQNCYISPVLSYTYASKYPLKQLLQNVCPQSSILSSDNGSFALNSSWHMPQTKLMFWDMMEAFLDGVYTLSFPVVLCDYIYYWNWSIVNTDPVLVCIHAFEFVLEYRGEVSLDYILLPNAELKPL